MCGVARAFDLGNGATADTQNFTCGWNAQWSADPQNMMQCKCE